MLIGGPTNTKLKVSDEVKAALASEPLPGAVRIDVDLKAEKLTLAGNEPCKSSQDEMFQVVVDSLLQDAQPCLVIIPLSRTEAALVAWTPGGSPPKLRMLCASSRKTVKEAFPSWTFKEYSTSDRAEVTYRAFVEATRELTEAERRDAMTQEELAEEDVKKRVASEQACAPKLMAGMAVLKVDATPAFKEALLASAAGGQACIGRLSGDKTPKLAGSVIADITGPSSLKGKLPADEACYIILRSPEAGMIMISWLPDGIPAKERMKTSSFKSAVLQLIKRVAEIDELPTAEITEESELADSLGVRAEEEEEEEPSAKGPAGRPGMCNAARMSKPLGGFALPGMGTK